MSLTSRTNQYKKNIFCFYFFVAFSLTANSTFANEESSTHNKWGATVGASWEYGQLGSSGMGLNDRTMSALSFEALPGYRLKPEWFVGIDFNYRFQSQLASLDDAGQTNLRGKGWLLGFGAQYQLNEKWAIQGALDFFGRYDFDNQTAANEDDYLSAPLSLRFKGQYFFQNRWSADASLNYLRWNNFHVAGNDFSETATQWMIGAGITYHFGEIAKIEAGTSETSNQPGSN